MYKVLIVDDEELDLKGMQTFIPWESLGLEIVGAVHSGFDAYEILAREPVDILVTDVHMPSMSGLELAEKALELHERIRVIFVSGYQDFHYVKQALSLRAWDYVLKPMDDAELEQALRKLADQLDREKAAMAAARQASSAQTSPAREPPTDQEQRLPAAAPSKPSKNARLIAEVVHYVESRLHENITLKEVADAFAFSPNYLGALFKEETGVNFSEHLIDRKMRIAGEMLRGTRLRIYEIADRVGYKYMPYFSRQFKETFGVTPNEYRRQE
ncbi:response regulator [Paenibacillus sp. D51F]